MSEWISVKDRLPIEDNKVLICENGIIFTACFLGTRWCNYYDRSHENPSHWMPLPEIPHD